MYKMSIDISNDSYNPSIIPKADNVFPDNDSEAIKHSIEKWEWIYNYCKDNKNEIMPDTGISTCALCQLHYKINSCEGCPIRDVVNNWGCYGTPYEKTADLFYKPIIRYTLEVIKEEIDFLKSLEIES